MQVVSVIPGRNCQAATAGSRENQRWACWNGGVGGERKADRIEHVVFGCQAMFLPRIRFFSDVWRVTEMDAHDTTIIRRCAAQQRKLEFAGFLLPLIFETKIFTEINLCRLALEAQTDCRACRRVKCQF